jgi:hypothetical protein
MPIQVIKDTPGNVLWTTDKAEINSESAAVTYQVLATALGTANAVGNLHATVVSVPNGTPTEIYVGAGNYLIITGNNFTARALGTASSAQSGVIGYGSTP